jgi:signal transduction histidine kinase
LVAGKELDEARRELALLDERLRQAAERLRTFGEVARGAEQQEEEVVLWPLVGAYVREFARQYPILRKQVLITDGYPVDLRVRIRRMGLRQVLFNLILNAVQQIRLFSL